MVALPGPWPGDRCYRATALCGRAVQILEEGAPARHRLDPCTALATTVFPSRRCKRDARGHALGADSIAGHRGGAARFPVQLPGLGIGADRPPRCSRPAFVRAAGTFHTSASRSVSSPRWEPRLPGAGRGQRSSRWRGSTPRVAYRTAVQLLVFAKPAVPASSLTRSSRRCRAAHATRAVGLAPSGTTTR